MHTIPAYLQHAAKQIETTDLSPPLNDLLSCFSPFANCVYNSNPGDILSWRSIMSFKARYSKNELSKSCKNS
jgi:hypothetical protein